VQNRNLLVRVATTLVAAPVLLGVLLAGPALGWYLLVALTVAFGSVELFAMTHPGDRVSQCVGVAGSVLVSATLYWFWADPRVIISLILVVTLGGMLATLWRIGDIATATRRMTALVAGPFYVGALLTPVALLRRDLGSDGPGYALFVLLLAWFGDTGAYFFGRTWGRTPLCPQVSPKKTRAGLVGALFGGLSAALLAHCWFLPRLPLRHAILLGLLGGVLGQLGDLVESLLKRSSGIKDSGRLIPGHGGILDRVDALMAVGPLVYLYALWAGPGLGVR
jgi:phosphatidate cytidylyltransferase